MNIKSKIEELERVNNPDIVPQATAARVLGIRNRQKINNWIDRGKVRAVQTFGAAWVSIEECRRLLESDSEKDQRQERR